MKKILIILSLVTSATFLCPCIGGGTSFAQKFVYVDTKYILENIPEYKAAQKQLDQLSIDWQKEIETKFSEIDQLYKAFQAEAIVLPEDMKKKREEEIIQKEKEVKELQKKRFGKDGDLFKKRQELVKPIQDKVYDAIKVYATKNMYAIIFDKTETNILFGDHKYDKSDDILRSLGIAPPSEEK